MLKLFSFGGPLVLLGALCQLEVYQIAIFPSRISVRVQGTCNLHTTQL